MGYTNEKTAQVNEAFLSLLHDEGVCKEAAEYGSEYTRVYMREECITDKVLPPITVGNDSLDRQHDTDKPVIVVDKEPAAPAAISVPFGQLPANRYIRAPRYRVLFARIESTRYSKDADELRTYDMDVRQVLSDNMIKDMATEKDAKFFSLVDVVVGSSLYAAETGDDAAAGTVSGTPTTTGSGQSQNYILINSAGITRSAVVEMKKILPANDSRMETQTIVCNTITIKDTEKWGRDEVGGDMSEEVLINGWAERTLVNCRWIVTIKRDIVPNNTFYLFVAPKALGVHFLLEDTTMWIKREAMILEFFAYQTVGLSIGNTNGVAKCKIVRSV